jgi:F-type H+-transporting ATPase subunit delta
MKISKQARREAKALFRSCQANGLLDEGRLRLVLQTVVAKKPRGYLGILSQLARLLKLDQERHNARVESAVPLTAEMQAKVRSDLARRHGPALNLSFRQNPALIGGLRIQVGSDVYDGSVLGRLQSLEEAF